MTMPITGGLSIIAIQLEAAVPTRECVGLCCFGMTRDIDQIVACIRGWKETA